MPSTDPARGTPPPALPPAARHPGEIRVGRADDNDIVVSDLLTARHHARLIPAARGYVLHDLSGRHQTFVAGKLVDSPAPLRDGDVVTFGKSRFVLAGPTLQAIPDQPESGDLVVDHVSYTLPHGQRLTNDISMTLTGPRLVAVIGPSGSGKSTLLRLISGELAPTEGAVRHQGIDTHHNQEEIHGRIGVVPQHTIAHHKLTARRALSYAAQLRLAVDATGAERKQRVDAVLTELSLDEHARTQIQRMSGGQQRRLAIGFELLTRPSLILLDEPTSGLDPALVRQIMNNLRRLADDGRQIIVTTHDLDHLDVCDDVLIMLPGGTVEYYGPPSGIEAHFGTTDWADIFETLKRPATETPGRTWRRPARRTKNAERAPEVVGPQAADQSRVRQQMWVLCRRQLRLIFADRGYALFLLLLPVVLALLTFVIPNETGLGRPTDPRSTEAMRLLVILVVGSAFMGMAATVRDLVAERSIYRHERAAGLKPEAYLASKLIIFCGVAALQTTLLVMLILQLRDGPEDGVIAGSGNVEVGIALGATAVVCAVFGLLVSAIVATPEQTMPPLVIAIMAQLVLCGGLIEITGQAVVSQLAWLAPSRWGFAMGASTVDVTNLVPNVADDVLWRHHPLAWLGALLILTALATAAAWLTRHRLRST